MGSFPAFAHRGAAGNFRPNGFPNHLQEAVGESKLCFVGRCRTRVCLQRVTVVTTIMESNMSVNEARKEGIQEAIEFFFLKNLTETVVTAVRIFKEEVSTLRICQRCLTLTKTSSINVIEGVIKSFLMFKLKLFRGIFSGLITMNTVQENQWFIMLSASYLQLKPAMQTTITTVVPNLNQVST